MGGVVGTAVMFAEACGCRLELQLDDLQPPAGVELEAWLSCFPSFGYLLAVDPARSAALLDITAGDADLLCRPIGRFRRGPAALELHAGGAWRTLWSQQEALTGFGALCAMPPSAQNCL
jgi:uncharacterized protein